MKQQPGNVVRSDQVPRYEIRVGGSGAPTTATITIEGECDLLTWVLQVVGPRALRDYVLEHLSEERLTTQQAADLLGMSRPSLIKLLEAGQMTYSMVGTRRYVDLQSVEAYRRKLLGQSHSQRGRNSDRVVDEQLRALQRLAEDEADFA